MNQVPYRRRTNFGRNCTKFSYPGVLTRGIRAPPPCPGLKLSISKVCIVFRVSVNKRSAADSDDATEMSPAPSSLHSDTTFCLH